jgi:putative selenium metabolism protein SsnA
MMRILIKNGTVITLGESNKILKDQCIIIKDKIIEKICKSSPKDEEFDKVIDAKGKIILPGFINAHMHFYSSYSRGLYKAKPSKNFTEILENLWWKLDKLLTLDDVYYSALIALVGCIKSGTTTIIDHHASPFAIKGSLKKIADAVLEAGVRANLCYELSCRDGPEIAKLGIDENVEFIKYCKELKSDQLTALFGLHASFTIDDETLKIASEEGRKLGAGFHIHCAEDLADQKVTKEKFGKSVVERLRDANILGGNTILGHCIHLSDEELEMIAQSKTNVVHNPQSNMNNAVGVADIVKMTKKNILVGLGTDAMTNNMMEELRSAMWIQKLHQKDPSSSFMEVTNLLVHNNAKIAKKFFGDVGIGELKEGGVADLILIEYYPPTEFDENTFLGHLVFGISQCKVDTTICRGKILMENAKLCTLDEEKIMAKALELSKKLWDKF